MDPRTALIVSVVMMLLNGGVLGLMHSSLPREVQPSATSWRIGTLLVAGGQVLLAVQDFLPAGFVLPLANGMLALGVTGYWRAARQYMGQADTPWLLLPTLAMVPGIWWFAVVDPSVDGRIVFASLIAAVLVFGGAWALRSKTARRTDVSHRVLAGILLVVGVFLLLRASFHLLAPGTVQTSIDPAVVLNGLTFLMLSTVPVVGTTAFLLMCADRLRRDVEHAAATDYLTALPNRRTITRAGDALQRRARAGGRSFAVAVLDVDHFKSINDRHGHAVGDEALRHLAHTMRGALRATDAIGRQGGEEFVALFDAADPGQSLRLAEGLREVVAAAPLRHGGLVLPITISIGLADWQPGDADFDDLLRRADHALLRAKQAGRNRVARDAAADAP